MELEVACPRAALAVDDETARVLAEPIEVAPVIIDKNEHLRRHWTESVCHTEVRFARAAIPTGRRRTSSLIETGTAPN
jgi:hypothetical protein